MKHSLLAASSLSLLLFKLQIPYFFISCMLWKLSSWSLLQLNIVFASHFLDLIYKNNHPRLCFTVLWDNFLICLSHLLYLPSRFQSLSLCISTLLWILSPILCAKHLFETSLPFKPEIHLGFIPIFLKMDTDFSTLKKKNTKQVFQRVKSFIYTSLLMDNL